MRKGFGDILVGCCKNGSGSKMTNLNWNVGLLPSGLDFGFMMGLNGRVG